MFYLICMSVCAPPMSWQRSEKGFWNESYRWLRVNMYVLWIASRSWKGSQLPLSHFSSLGSWNSVFYMWFPATSLKWKEFRTLPMRILPDSLFSFKHPLRTISICSQDWLYNVLSTGFKVRYFYFQCVLKPPGHCLYLS